MKTLIALVIALALPAHAAGRRAPAPGTTNPPVEELNCDGGPDRAHSLVYLGPGASRSMMPGGEDAEYMAEAYCYLNTVYANGCLEQKVKEHPFITLESDIAPFLSPSERQKAWDLFKAGAPYPIDHRWYTKRFSRVIGYTYSVADNLPGEQSETRVWTNWNNIGGTQEMAAHTGHELSHQKRAHAYLHMTRFSGSYPYDLGDLVAECIQEHFYVKTNMSEAVDFLH